MINNKLLYIYDNYIREHVRITYMFSMNNFTMIVAMCEKTRGIGYQGTIPWKSKEDMAFFRTTTTTVPSEEYINVVIMGRKTFESLGSRPLKERLNIVCSRTTEKESPDDNLWFAKSLSDAL
jgi:dihydrofolate reductase